MGFYSSGYIASGYYEGSVVSGDVNAEVQINTTSTTTAQAITGVVVSINSTVTNNIVVSSTTTTVIASNIELVVFGNVDIPDSMIAWTERIGRQQIIQQREIDQLRLDSLNYLTGPDIQPLFNGRGVIFYV